MSLDLGFNTDQLYKLQSEIEKTDEYAKYSQKLRAAVLLTVQELTNQPEKSALSQFEQKLPDFPNIKTALAFAAEFLKEKGFQQSLSVLNSELHPEDLEEGQLEMESIVKEKYPKCKNASEALIQMVHTQ